MKNSENNRLETALHVAGAMAEERKKSVDANRSNGQKRRQENAKHIEDAVVKISKSVADRIEAEVPRNERRAFRDAALLIALEARKYSESRQKVTC